MIIGGYNIIDFGGKEFSDNQSITVDKDIVDKLKDVTKPCVIGNFTITSSAFNGTVALATTSHYITSGAHTHSFGIITVSVTGDTTIMFGT